MCGIACVVTNENAPKVCYEALEKLEYRGYDSCGIAGIKDGFIEVYKQVGRVVNLKSFSEKFDSNMVIAHTRWATHGSPSEKNSHPHMSFDNSLAIVHNGIIENHEEIRKSLEKENIMFVSETDSECIANYIAHEKGDILQNISKMKHILQGGFAVAILDKSSKKIYGVRRKNPLYVSKTTKGIMLVSDIVCFSGIANSYYLVPEHFIVEISQDDIKFYDENIQECEVEEKKLSKIENKIDLCGFEYYMEKEIFEIPEVIDRIILNYKQKDYILNLIQLFQDKKSVHLIGCGTAYHACLYGAKILEKALNIPCIAHIASEFRYGSRVIDNNSIAILVSQSGETQDTIGCAELLKEKGIKTVAITNVEHSFLAQICDFCLPVFAGKEIAVASTKAYIAQVLVFYILYKTIQNGNYKLEDLMNFSLLSRKMLNINKQIIELVKEKEKIFFIGRQIDSVTAVESALKLKEISYKSAEGYAAGEIKHGTIALIEKDTPVVVFATNRSVLEKTLMAGQEVKSRGAKVILVAGEKVDKKGFDYKIDIPENVQEELMPILSIIPFQLLAFNVSKELGYNPDMPRNLAKSVTVE